MFIVTSGSVKGYHKSLRGAAVETLKLEERKQTWTLYNNETGGYIYLDKEGKIRKLGEDNQGIINKDDHFLKQIYTDVRNHILRGRTAMSKFLGTSEDIQKKMGIENLEDFRFFIFSRDDKVRETKKFTDFTAWFRNRSPNRTLRGIHLFYKKLENSIESAMISTVFRGAISKAEINNAADKYIALFETVILFPEEGLMHSYQYNTYQDAKVGHDALSKMNPTDLYQHVKLEQDALDMDAVFVEAN